MMGISTAWSEMDPEMKLRGETVPETGPGSTPAGVDHPVLARAAERDARPD
ncbi:hypothetical protein [Rhizosaccharibacter radicis]|uniref:Uncharacterized protein n=1 Tax=Rhizosaccharibacter radicis TaxID=2782605 RepID=A0ABT1W1C0_9PROT|nr:hypothetical protein [Acetobacteraceae bacterium KSS12]